MVKKKGWKKKSIPFYSHFRFNKNDPIKYEENGRELKDLVKFIEEHNTVLAPPDKDEL